MLTEDKILYNNRRKQIIDTLVKNMNLNNWIHPFKKAEDKIRARVDLIVNEWKEQSGQ